MRAILIPALFLAACGSDRALLSDGDDETSTTIAPSTTSSAATIDVGSTGLADTSSSTTTFAESTSSTSTDPAGCPFLCAPDLGDAIIEDCDLWAQDCPLGMKCMPWANDGGNSWNATRCSAIADDPTQAGEPCTVEGSGVSGIDDCDRAAMCWAVDADTGSGTCIDLCQGSAQDPICLDASSHCTIANEGFLVLCLPLCDPLLQNCAEGEACYPVYDVFTCSPDAQPQGLYGDPCEYVNVCDPGLFCGAVEDVPDCSGSLGCCTSYCDLAADEPDAVCPDVADGQTCAPWYGLGEAPPGFAHIGYCTMPA